MSAHDPSPVTILEPIPGFASLSAADLEFKIRTVDPLTNRAVYHARYGDELVRDLMMAIDILGALKTPASTSSSRLAWNKLWNAQAVLDEQLADYFGDPLRPKKPARRKAAAESVETRGEEVRA